MSNNAGRFPTEDGKRNIYYEKVVPFLNKPANITKFGIETIILGVLNTAFGLWGPNFKLLNDVTTCTSSVVHLKDSLIVRIEGTLNIIFGDISTSVLTADDRDILQIFERLPASPAVISEIGPGLSFDSLGHLWAIIHFNNTATPQSKAAPRENFIHLEFFIGEFGLAHASIPFANGTMISKSSHHFTFTEAEVGKTMYVRCFYQIKSGERSPASNIISFQIS